MTKLEQIAAAIADRIPGGYVDHLGEGPSGAEFLGMARAAVEAMREPTDAMQKASRFEKGCGCPCCNVADDYHAMIDAALNEKPE